VLFQHPSWVVFNKRYENIIDYAAIDLGAYTLSCVKSIIIIGTAPYIKSMGRRLTTNERATVRYNTNKGITAVTTVSASGRKNVQGCKLALKATQSYPMGFGSAHALLYNEHSKDCVGRPADPLPANTDSDSDSAFDECMKDFLDPHFHWDSNIMQEHVVDGHT